MASKPPAKGCIDLHELTGGWRSDERELLIRSNKNVGARLELDARSPVFAEGVDLETLAPGGWACPGGRIFVRGGDTVCPVVRMSLLSKPELGDALRARAARIRPTTTLDPIQVRGHHWRDIRGTTDQCVDARFLRGWNWSNKKGLVIEVSPRRHSGHRYYQVETVENCRDLANASDIRLKARSGGAAVCGRPGDTVFMRDTWTEQLQAAGSGARGFPPTSHLGRIAMERGCEISRVTPLP